jgi:hypothetical protein
VNNNKARCGVATLTGDNMKSFVQRLVDKLIEHAMRTPYFHLPGYMDRYWLVKPRWWTLGCSIRVHHILRSDEDRVLHDHPWPFATVILRGGYFEDRPIFTEPPDWIVPEPTTTTFYGPGSILVRRSTSRHRLVLPRWKDAWTLFMMGPRRQVWGFYTPHGKIAWDEYLAAPDAMYQRDHIALHRGAH